MIKFYSKVILLVSLLYGCSVTKQPIKNCRDYLKGKFIYNAYNESGLGHWKKRTWFIEINDSLEIVTSRHFPNDTTISKIIWLGQCEYRLQLTNPKTRIDTFLINMHPIGQHHKVIQANGKYVITKKKGVIDTLWREIDNKAILDGVNFPSSFR